MGSVGLRRWHVRLLLALWCLTLFPTPLLASTQVRSSVAADPIVHGAMLRYFKQMGGEAVLGAPLTNELQEDGLVVQYFENARLEWWPRRNEVRLSPLGRLLYPHWRFFAGEEAVKQTSAQQYFPETGHAVRFAFLEFFQKHGGVKTFGLPISGMLPADDDWHNAVQYFERAVFRYDPTKAGTPGQVQLAPLGRAFLVLRDPSQQVPVQPERTGRSSGPKLMTQVALFYDPNLDYVLSLAKAAGFTGIKQQVPWKAIETRPGGYIWGQVDRIVEAANRHGLDVLLSVYAAPLWLRRVQPAGDRIDGPESPEGISAQEVWELHRRFHNGPPADFGDYGDFMELIASRYGDKVQAYELWNEPNLAGNWDGRVAPGEFVELVAVGYRGVKRGNPNATVIAGGLGPTGVNIEGVAMDDVRYLEAMYQYRDGMIRNYFDALGVHSYGYNNAPNDTPDNYTTASTTYKDHWSFFFRRFEQHWEVLQRHGDTGKRIWMTEMGWTTHNLHPEFAFGDDVSEEDQARFLVEAYQLVKERYWYVEGMVVFNLNFANQVLAGQVAPTDSAVAFSILDKNLQPRPAYLALQALEK